MSKKIKLGLLLLSLFALLSIINSAQAQDFGTNAVSNTIALTQADPRVIVGRIIQIILSFLGVIALGLIMYAGFMWMTSNGDEEKIGSAKKILTSSVIGLVIILSSWAIATFVLSRMGAATGVGGINIIGPNNNGTFSDAGMGAIGACSVSTFYPSDGQKDVPRNTSIMITFKEAVKLDSACTNAAGSACACNQTDCNKINPEAIRIYKKDLGDACSKGVCLKPNSNIADAVVNVTDSGKTLIVSPSAPIGSPSADTEYLVRFSNQLKKIDGNSMFKSCGADFFEYGFTVNTSLDLTPPQVLKNGIFPLPDNIADTQTQIAGRQAVATINYSGPSCPNIYSESKVISVTPVGPDISNLNINKSQITNFKLSITNDAPDTIQLFNGTTDEALGSAPIDENGVAQFNDYFTFRVNSHKAGDMWVVVMQPGTHSDNMFVGGTQYIFVAESDASSRYNFIGVPANCSGTALMDNMVAKISGNPDVSVVKSPTANVLNLTARKAGVNGNDINLNSTTDVLKVTPFAGGVDPIANYVAQDKTDRPMNSALQINFNEPVNPLTVSGTADEASSSIRIVNANASSSPAGTSCAADADCRSYKCDNKICVGNYLGGKFEVSNQYRTLEFVTDRECGVNACGEKIFCFPANSHLSVELMASNLKTCTSSNDCLSYGTYNTCSSTPLGYSTCQDISGKNYPLARLDKLDGIVDAAINSFDGARDLTSDGPLSFYYENNVAAQNVGKKDNFKWSFYIGGKIKLDPPQITFLSHPQGKKGVSLADPIQINFNTLMLNSSLHTGSNLITSGAKTITHKSINLSSASPSPFGYWISSENQDVYVVDGEPDTTVVRINHSPFMQALNYKAQIGSGVKDIYQNCFKPSGDKTCGVTPEKPSCCFGVATNDLDENGNCK